MLCAARLISLRNFTLTMLSSPSTLAKVKDGASQATISSDSRVDSPEWTLLLQCASSHAMQQAQPHPSLDWPLLLRLANRHGVLGILVHRLQTCTTIEIPPFVLDQLADHRRSYAAFTLQLTAELSRILDAFRSRTVDLLLTKGPALSVRCYADPAVRQYSDLDLVVRHSDIRRATEFMIGLGYQPKIPLDAIAAGKTPGEYNFTKPGTPLLIEFHTERTFRYHPRPLPIETLFARSTSVIFDGRTVPALSLEDELILISIHGAKHFWERLLWITDVAALAQHPAVDWDRVNSAAQGVRADRILNLGLYLAGDLLSVPLPSARHAAISADRALPHLAAEVAARLSSAEPQPLSLFDRAAFRMRMHRSFFDGAQYLVRLTVSPTEEDWANGRTPTRPSLFDALFRPARLTRKHRIPKK
jgi:putative nucleotidyltransferase-like protein